MSEETPEGAYRMLHERVMGAAPSPGERSLSAAQYDAARAAYLDERGVVARPGVSLWPPTSQTLMKHLGDGSWARAMEALGLSSNAGRTRGTSAFSDDDYLRAVREFLTAATDDTDNSVASTSFAAYAAWAKASSTGAGTAGPDGASPRGASVNDASLQQVRRRPSGAAVRQHFGSWAAAKEAVAHPASTGSDGVA